MGWRNPLPTGYEKDHFYFTKKHSGCQGIFRDIPAEREATEGRDYRLNYENQSLKWCGDFEKETQLGPPQLLTEWLSQWFYARTMAELCLILS